MTSGIRAQLLVSAALLGCVAASPAIAQNEQQPKQQAAKANNDDEAIVVTAQRRAQSLIDVPQSVSVIGGETLEQQQAKSFSITRSSFRASTRRRTIPARHA